DKARARGASVEQRAVYVRAVGYGVGIAIAFTEALVERNIDDPLAADAIHHEQTLDEYGFALDQLAHPQGIERGPRIRRELDAGAQLAELVRLLEHDDAKALDGKS